MPRGSPLFIPAPLRLNFPPPIIPDHELLRVIGRGSYGEVWLARNVMGVLRAVKVVYRARFDHDRPFEREFGGIQRYEPLSRTGEGLVQVLHVGRNDSAGCFYYVMELADDAEAGPAPDARPNAGTYAPRTLRSDLERLRRLPVDECLEIAVALTTGLAQLHRHRLVHRDLKPSNVIFVNGRAKLADVGLVAGADESRSFVGTEGFVPPEGPGRATADLFGLSRLLYQAATGLEPDRFPEIPQDWLGAPEATGLIEFHEVLLKLGEGSAARRYQNAADVLADLALLRSGKSVRQLRTLERRVVWFRRLGTTALVALAVAGVAWLWTAREARRERENFSRLAAAEQRARRELINAQLAQARAERLAGGLDRRDAGLRALTNAARLQPDPESRRALRSEAAATLAQPGFRWVPAPASLRHLDPMGVVCDGTQEWAARWLADGAIVVNRIGQTAELARLPAPVPPPDEVLGFNGSRRFLALRRGEDRLIGDLTKGTYCRTNPLATFGPADRLWVAGPDGALHLETLPKGEIVRQLPCPAELISDLPWRRLAATESGPLAAVNGAGTIVWWNGSDPTPAGRLRTDSEIYSLAWNRAGDLLAAGTTGGDVLLWRLPDPTVQWQVRAHTAAVRRLAFGVGDRTLAVASEGEELSLLEVGSGRRLASLPAIVWNQSFRPSDQRLALVWRGGQPGFLEFVPAVGLEQRRGSRAAANDAALAFSPDGRWLAAGTVATVDVWDQQRGVLAASLPAVGIRAVAFAGDPPELRWLDDEGLARLPWPPGDTGPAVPPIRDRSRPWTHFTQASNGVHALADAAAESVTVQRPGAPEIRMGPHPGVRFVSVSGDGGRLATGSLAEPGIQLWDTENGQRLHRLPTGLNVRPLFSPDGRWLAAAGPTCSLWSGPDWHRVEGLPETPGNTVAAAAAFSPGGEWFAAVFGDHQVRLFRLPSLAPGLTAEAPGHARVLALAFSPDGRTLAVTTTEGEVLLWNLPALEQALAGLGLPE